MEDDIFWMEVGFLVGSGHSPGCLEGGGLKEGLMTTTVERGAQLESAGVGVDYIAGVERIIGGNWVPQVTSKGEGGEVSGAAVERHVVRSSKFN